MSASATVRILGVIAMLTALASPAVAQFADETERALIKLESDWNKARIDGDVTFLEKLYAREFRITGADGSVIERATDLALFAKREIKPESIENEDLKVTVYGDTAVMTGRENLRGCYRAVCGERSLRFTNVFVRRDGRWQLVANQGTWIAAKQ